MPYGLFDYTPDNTIHTMGLGLPPAPPPGQPATAMYTGEYAGDEQRPLPPVSTLAIPESPSSPRPPQSQPNGQGSPTPPVQGGVRPPDYGKAPPVVTLAIPENPGDPIPKIMAENPPKGTPSTPPTSPVWTPPTTVCVRAPCDQIEENPSGTPPTNPYTDGPESLPKPSPIVTLAIPENPGDPVPPQPGGGTPPQQSGGNQGGGGFGFPINPVTDGPESLPKPGTTPTVPSQPFPADPAPKQLVTQAMICSENIAACAKPPPLGPVTLAIPENPAAPTDEPKTTKTGEYVTLPNGTVTGWWGIAENPGTGGVKTDIWSENPPTGNLPPATPLDPRTTFNMNIPGENLPLNPQPIPAPTTMALGEEGPKPPTTPQKQWCGFASNMGAKIQRVCGRFSHHLQKGNPKGGTVIFVGGDMGVIVYPTFQQALDARRKGR